MATRNIVNYTAPADVDLLIPEIWAQKIYEEQKTTTLMERFTGPEGSRQPVIRKTELLGQPGDVVHISRINELTGSGYSGEGQIRGSEEKLIDASVSVIPVRVGHNTAWDWPSDKKSIGNMRQLALSKLGYWWAKNIDSDAWAAATQTASGGFDASAITRIWATGATSLVNITASTTFDTDMIDKMVARLRVNDVPPLVIDGGEYYPLLVHTNQASDLRGDSTWTQAQRDANIRGSSNPIFTGALGTYNGALLFESTNATTGSSTGTPSVQYAVAVALGAEALCVGEGSGIMWIEDADRYEGHFAVTVRQYYKYEILNHKNLVQCVTAAIDPT
jgi:N4-gp56 family major capsid protein